ncbi:MAG TPA: hypothetical protein VJP76_04925, partial [Candidatus Tumulicola sp.]|nr:hypothetical protein [Candidatus Tumulicola sp.]
MKPPYDVVAIKARAVETAHALGAAVRVTGAFPDDASRARMRASFERGDLATWGYDDAYARDSTAPQALLAGARAVLCFAIPYATAQPPDARGRGRVSNYA